ncbi:PREDICTED: growth-regulating factor 1 isoform X1 [Fragaria vesca subsp. vesca]|uniref:growth-regulating factor 1 isoform X1 n=1 Tax=Fragaria vesca subsp. vesca TaxID=101020 RepID=UPI0002C3770D|nr:PREDICTED: growth-regulating factor 1 isoform X1 [Fragaria vesca subsp. vesca]
MMSSSSAGRGMRFPFTPSQWQELEHQALIYKYMVSGIPIPPDLLFSIKRSCLDSPPLSSKLFSPHIGWNCFQMGLGRKIDPEPGRCRRTDGKKWRCSKEAYADSKYCERHMHRGKNRSRKPVEVFKATLPTSANSNSNSNSNTSPITKIFNPSSNSLSTPFHSLSSLSPNESSYNSSSSNLDDHPFLYSRPNIGLSQQERSTSLFLDSASYNNPLHPNLEYRPNRFGYGVKEEVDEHAFFSEPSGSVRGFSGSSSSLNHHQNESNWQLTMSCSDSSSKQRTCSALQTEHYPHLQLQNFTDSKRGEETQRTIHHFFDEGPPKDRESSWLDLDANNKSSNSGSASTTRLSISIPNSAHDFPIYNSRSHHDD